VAVDVPIEADIYAVYEITVWRISLYGGLKFADPENRGESSSLIGAMTGPARLKIK
jgi:hypothetical protein